MGTSRARVIGLVLGAACAGTPPDDTGVCEPDAAAGCQVGVSVNSDLDTDSEHSATNTYDERGNLLVSDYDSDCTVDERRAYTYLVDEHANVVRQEIDLGADGSVDEVLTYRYDYAYDVDGALLPIGCYTVAASGAAGDYNRVCNVYAADGVLVEEDWYAEDAESLFARVLLGYDATGRLLTRQVVYPSGQLPYVETYTYGEDCEAS